MAITQWMNFFSEYLVETLIVRRLDHKPILLTMNRKKLEYRKGGGSLGLKQSG